MKNTILTLTFVFTTVALCNAQQIKTEKVLGGFKYKQNGKNMTMGNLVKTMKSNQEAFDLIKKAQTNNTIASIIGFAGGGLIGYPLGTALGGGDANWTMAGIGAGLIAVGIPISSSANRKAKQAVDIYNASLESTASYEFKPEFKITANGNGMGLTMNF